MKTKPSHRRSSKMQGGHCYPTLDMLLDERKLIEERVLRSESMMFNFVTVVVTPVSALIGYALIQFGTNAKYAILVAPHFVIVATMIMATLYLHHYIAGNYGVYLVKKINESLVKGSPPLLLEKLDYVFIATGIGVQNGFLLISIILLGETIYCILFLIGRVLRSLPETGLVNYQDVFTVSIIYWVSLALMTLIAFVSCILQFTRKVKKLREVIQREDWKFNDLGLAGNFGSK